MDAKQSIPEYSQREMLYLANILREDTHIVCESIRKGILIGVGRSDKMAEYIQSRTSLTKLHKEEALTIFQMPLSQIPLYINSRKKHFKIVAKWRLNISE